MIVELNQKEIQQIILSLGENKYKDVYQIILKLTQAIQQDKPTPPATMAQIDNKR